MLQTQAKVSSVTKVLREGRRGGAKDFYITSDLNVELGVMCTDEEDIEELEGMYGPLCWQRYDKDPGGFKKLMWYGMMKEFNCKASSTWSVCGRARETAFTHRHLGPEKKVETSQLDFIIGPMRRNDEVFIHNDVGSWATWDHDPIFAKIQDEEQTKNRIERRTMTRLKMIFGYNTEDNRDGR